MEKASASDTGHSSHSSTREKVLEHLFVGDLLRCLWRKGIHDMEVLRAEVDKGGYDLVLDANGVMRHVQLKSSHRAAATSRIGVNVQLARKPSGHTKGDRNGRKAEAEHPDPGQASIRSAAGYGRGHPRPFRALRSWLDIAAVRKAICRRRASLSETSAR